MKYAVILAILVTTASAQMVHKVPFASSGNTLELAIENSATLAAQNVTVEAATVPQWIHLESRNIAVGPIPGKQEAVASFKFSVDKSAPVQKEEAISFAVVSESGQRWTKEIRVSVAPPAEFSLFQNYPNPFNPTTTVGFQLAAESKVRLSVYDLLGREIAVVTEDIKKAGYHEETLNGSSWSSGMYIVRLIAQRQNGSDYVAQKVMTVVK
ncbi:MAG TPA: T9SS type A sorting domain-containing protein [Bacteroidota bacterium]